MLRSMLKLSIHDHAYAALYKQCVHHFPEATQVLPKPEPLSEPAQDAPLQKISHIHQAAPAPLSPA